MNPNSMQYTKYLHYIESVLCSTLGSCGSHLMCRAGLSFLILGHFGTNVLCNSFLKWCGIHDQQTEYRFKIYILNIHTNRYYRSVKKTIQWQWIVSILAIIYVYCLVSTSFMRCGRYERCVSICDVASFNAYSHLTCSY